MTMFKQPRLGAVFGLFLVLFLVGCSGDMPKETFKEQDVDLLYNAGLDSINDQKYALAGRLFDEVERQHPYSIWATKAQLMQAYVKYADGRYEDAIAAADRFVQLHPGNKDVPYAFYIKAISYYEQIVDVGRDQKATDNALKALTEVVNRYPDSRYARDARLKIDLTRDHLAGKEMEIGRYYEKQTQYVAAINRFTQVVKNYETTTHVPEALARLVECYMAIGLTEEASKNAAVLGYNFPDSEWYRDTYALVQNGKAPTDGPQSKGFLDRALDSLF